MKLLYWAEQFHPYIGGIEVLTAGVLPHLQRRGFSCAVITSNGPMDLPDEDWFGSIPVYRFPFRQTLESREPQAVARLARRVGELESRLAPDLVHVFLSDPSCFFHLAARRSHPSRLVVSVHNSRSHAVEAGPSLLGRVLAEADWVLGNSSFTLEWMRAASSAIAERSSVLYSGVEGPAGAAGAFTLDPLRLVCLGRLVHAKGFDTALEALARLRPEHPDASLEVIGDGPSRSELEALAARLGVRDVVRFRGWIDPERVYEHLSRASVVLIPSRWPETLCQVAIQASLMARPIVATRMGGLPEVVVDGSTGLLVEPDDGAALAAAVHSLCESPAWARELAAAARSRALRQFTLSSYLEGVTALYRRIGGG